MLSVEDRTCRSNGSERKRVFDVVGGRLTPSKYVASDVCLEKPYTLQSTVGIHHESEMRSHVDASHPFAFTIPAPLICFCAPTATNTK
jgi:hypothetical protein